MATGPINPSSQSSHPSSSSSNIGAHRVEPTDSSEPDWIKIESAVHRAIQHSFQLRQDQLQQPQLEKSNLSPTLGDISKRLDGLGIAALERCLLYDSLNNIDSNDDNAKTEKERLGKNINSLEIEMKNSIQSLIQQYSHLHIDNDFFSDWWGLSWIEGFKRKISLAYMKEQFLNRVFCGVLFFGKLNDQINRYKKEILSHFFAAANQIDIEEVTFKPIREGTETHNRGKIPSKIVFMLGHQPICSVFYKPREAYIDQKIIEAFDAINHQLTSAEKSLDIELPTYKVITFLDDRDPFSIWQFIDGKHLEGVTADIAIKGLPAAPRLFQELLRMEPICKFLNISDLHSRNILFTNPDQINARIFLIDLESIQPGNSTGLFSEKPREIRELSAAELRKLKEFKLQIEQIRYRFVTLPTSHFLGGLTRCDSFTELAEQVFQSIKLKGYTTHILQDELEWLILNDFLYNDGPYLTEYRGQIYYGVPNQNKVIAKR